MNEVVMRNRLEKETKSELIGKLLFAYQSIRTLEAKLKADAAAERDAAKECLKPILARIEHFADMPEPPEDMPLLGIIWDTATSLRQAVQGE
jgi:hypothetical protein